MKSGAKKIGSFTTELERINVNMWEENGKWFEESVELQIKVTGSTREEAHQKFKQVARDRARIVENYLKKQAKPELLIKELADIPEVEADVITVMVAHNYGQISIEEMTTAIIDIFERNQIETPPEWKKFFELENE
jgi:hypothetical protein